MTQGNLLDVVVRQDKPHKRVRPTSVKAYEIGRESFKGRKGDVLRWLAAFWNKHNESPTSAELAEYNDTWMSYADCDGPFDKMSWDAKLLYVRRGLSDLQRPSRTIQSTVEVVKDAARPCRVTGQTCCTWRIIERGTR